MKVINIALAHPNISCYRIGQINEALTTELQNLLALSAKIVGFSVKNESYDGALEVLESILEFGVLKSIRDAKECLEAFRTENEKTEDSIVSSDCSHGDRLQSVSGTETASDQVFFAATPKNVSKRRRQRRDQGQSSFEDSLKDVDSSEIDLIKKESEVVNEIQGFGDLCAQNPEKTEFEKIEIKNANCWRPWKGPGDVSEVVDDSLLEKTSPDDALNVIENEKYLWEDRSIVTRNDGVLERLSTSIASIKVSDNVYDETANDLRGCNRVNIQIQPSRKLSVLDQEKFLTEPISPIVSLDTIDGAERRSDRLLAAVNSTFDSSISSSQNKSDSSPRLQSIVKSPSERGSRASRNISFASEARVHFFARAQGFVSVPKMGGSSLGMAYYSSHEDSLPLPPEPDRDEDSNAASKKRDDISDDNKENQRKSKRLSVSASTSALPTIKDDSSQEGSWTSSIQKPGVIKLKKVTSLSDEGDVSKDDRPDPVKEDTQSRSRKGRKMTRSSSKGGLAPPPPMNDSGLSDSSFQLNTSKNSSRKGELGITDTQNANVTVKPCFRNQRIEEDLP